MWEYVLVVENLYFSALEHILLNSKQIILSRTTKEDEEASSYRLTKVCGNHHGWTVVLVGTEFFYSSVALQAWQLRGIYRRSTHTEMRVKSQVK